MDIVDRGCEEVDKQNLHIEACFLDWVADSLGLIAIAVESLSLVGQGFYHTWNLAQCFQIFSDKLYNVSVYLVWGFREHRHQCPG
jgi:hypothetical protein